MSKRLRLTLAGLAVVFLLTPQLRAQSEATTGVIEGSVVDPSGGALPGASVSLKNTATNFEQTLTTNQQGRFRGLLLPLGPYRVTISLQGFATLRSDARHHFTSRVAGAPEGCPGGFREKALHLLTQFANLARERIKLCAILGGRSLGAALTLARSSRNVPFAIVCHCSHSPVSRTTGRLRESSLVPTPWRPGVVNRIPRTGRGILQDDRSADRSVPKRGVVVAVHALIVGPVGPVPVRRAGVLWGALQLVLGYADAIAAEPCVVFEVRPRHRVIVLAHPEKSAE